MEIEMNHCYKTTFLIVITLFLGSCNSQKRIATKEQYEVKPKNERLLYIHNLLVNEGLLSFSTEKAKVLAENLAPFNYTYEFIDYILLKSSSFSILKERYGLVDFEETLHKAIPTLYYSYSRTNYEKAPNNWKGEAAYFINNHMKYFYHYGEEKFRRKVNNYLDTINSNTDFFLFNFFTENGDRSALANGERDNPKFYNFFNVIMWFDEYNFSEFCKLSNVEQAELFTLMMKYYLFLRTENETVFQIPESAINEIEEYWKTNAELLLKSPKISALDYNKRVGECVPTIILELQKVFNKRKE